MPPYDIKNSTAYNKKPVARLAEKAKQIHPLMMITVRNYTPKKYIESESLRYRFWTAVVNAGSLVLDCLIICKPEFDKFMKEELGLDFKEEVKLKSGATYTFREIINIIKNLRCAYVHQSNEKKYQDLFYKFIKVDLECSGKDDTAADLIGKELDEGKLEEFCEMTDKLTEAISNALNAQIDNTQIMNAYIDCLSKFYISKSKDYLNEYVVEQMISDYNCKDSDAAWKIINKLHEGRFAGSLDAYQFCANTLREELKDELKTILDNYNEDEDSDYIEEDFSPKYIFGCFISKYFGPSGDQAQAFRSIFPTH